MSSGVVDESDFFNPTQISGCQLWLDAADVNGNSSKVPNFTSISTWVDKTTNGRNAVNQATAAILISNVQNGLPALRFNGVSNYQITYNSFPNTAYTIISLQYLSVSDANYHRVVHAPSGGDAAIFVGASGINVATFTGNASTAWNDVAANTPNVSNLNSWRIVTTRVSSSTLTPYVDGTAQNNKTGTTGAFSGLSIGGWPGLPGVGGLQQTWIGDVAEIIIYSSALSPAEIQQVEGYLAWKWGIQSNLPANHPYRNSVLGPLLNPPTTAPEVDESDFFNPRQISGCQLWLDAADPNGNTIKPAEGSLVSSWSDKSGLGNNATAVGTITYRDNSMVYNTANGTYFLGNTSNTTDSLTLFTVCLVNTVANSPRLFSAATANNVFAYNTISAFTLATNLATTSLRAYRNNTNLSVLTMPVGSSFIDTQLFDGTNNTHFLNGTAGTPVASAGSFNLLVYNVGSINGEQQNVSFNGRFQEVILYPSALNQGQRQQVEGYLAWKWGLQSSLPANHPYKNSVLGPLVNPSTGPAIINQASWIPTNITGCAIWLDAANISSITLSGSNVTTWRDSTTNARNFTQATVSQQPRYDAANKFVLFDGVDDVLTGPDYVPVFSNPSAFNVFVVGNALSITTNNANPYDNEAFIGDAGGYQSIFVKTGTVGSYYYDSNNGTLQTSQSFTPGVISIMQLSLQNSLLRNVLNGSTTSSTPATLPIKTAGITSVFQLGGQYVTAPTFNRYLNCRIYEVVIYNVALTIQQQNQVEGYLAWKWGLTGNLPASHPFKFWPPPPQ